MSRQFIVVAQTQFHNTLYRTNLCFTYNEIDLREWAAVRWGTPKTATLKAIAREIEQRGWMLCEFTGIGSEHMEVKEVSDELERDKYILGWAKEAERLVDESMDTGLTKALILGKVRSIINVVKERRLVQPLDIKSDY